MERIVVIVDTIWKSIDPFPFGVICSEIFSQKSFYSAIESIRGYIFTQGWQQSTILLWAPTSWGSHFMGVPPKTNRKIETLYFSTYPTQACLGVEAPIITTLAMSDTTSTSEPVSVVKVWSLRIVAFILALGVLSIQLSKPVGILIISLSVAIFMALALHLLNPKFAEYKGERPTPLSFNYYLSQDAAVFVAAFVQCQIYFNVLWALRWLFGVNNIATGLYAIKPDDMEILYTCGDNHPNSTFGAPFCNVLASFLQRPGWLYCHVSGAIVSLALGPFQLWEPFRKEHPVLHKKMGYLYTTAVFIGGIGSIGLIVTSKTGGFAGFGFITLLLCWWSTLIIGIRAATSKDYFNHHLWMLRNYSYTFSAVPFRFLPAIYNAFGTDPEVGYPLGAWTTIIGTIIWSEYFVAMIIKSKSLAAADGNAQTNKV